MELTPKILIVGQDEKLPGEVEAAMSVIPDLRPVVHTVLDYRQGLEAARSRRPDLALVEMTRDLDTLRMFVEEVALGSPETAVVAVFHPSIFGPDVSEGSFIIEAIRAGVQDFLPRPLSSTDLDRFLDRMFRRTSSAPRTKGRIITFCANKGGVGKSTLSCNVACGLAQRFPRRVLLIDASLQMGVSAPMLGLRPNTTITDAVRERARLDETLLRELAVQHPCGLDLLAAPRNAVEAAEVDDEVISLILTLARRSYDYVVVDTFPMLDRVMMAVLDFSDCAYVVTESVSPSLLGAIKMVELLDELGFPKHRRRIILNRYSNFEGNLKAEVVAKRFGQKLDHIIPYQKKLLIHANQGEPFILKPMPLTGALRRALEQLINEVASLSPVSIDWTRRRGRGKGEAIKETTAIGSARSAGEVVS